MQARYNTGSTATAGHPGLCSAFCHPPSCTTPGMKFHKLVGLSGVAAHESAATIRWGKRFEWPMLLVASWIFVQWYLEATGQLGQPFLRLSDWIVWLFFLIETVVLVSLVRDRRGYLGDNWMNVAIIGAGFPILWDYTPLVGLLRQPPTFADAGAPRSVHPQRAARGPAQPPRLHALDCRRHHVGLGHRDQSGGPGDRLHRGWDLVCLGDLDHRRLRGRCAQQHLRGASSVVS